MIEFNRRGGKNANIDREELTRAITRMVPDNFRIDFKKPTVIIGVEVVRVRNLFRDSILIKILISYV
jgi:hypothetical protein